MKKPHNNKAQAFLERLPKASLDAAECMLAKRCKFNFKYFDNAQQAGQDFSDWTKENLCKLFDKLKYYSEKSLIDWTRTKIGAGKNHVLEIYGAMPNNSDFSWPKHVPHQVSWARFRLEGDMRLIGFVLPADYNMTVQRSNGFHFDTNTFYVVFLDENHRFYKTR